ncbi:competence protein ComG [Mesobacillus campisalis]|uniref:Competence protein ComG n=1 Tax=Mesobacillus campisalis TaxID=1408103 RepID=A0A0M2SKT1_9BACI|nr:competence type IV pilus assembly protein ComGB [Mesobacillus campisalis]KKK33205.1 competence protein ComG [Mesobacillus campisalis]
MSKKRKWAVVEQAVFLKRIGELLSRGYPLADAIGSLSFYLDQGRKSELKSCHAQLKEGYPFFRILAELQFNKDLVSYVYFAEQHGGLAQAIAEGSDMVLKRSQDLRRMKNLVSYPVFLLFLTSILFYFVDQVLLPNFTALYQNMNVSQNMFSKVLTAVGTYMPLLLYVLLFISLAIVCYYFFLFRKHPELERRARLVQIPLAGRFFRLLNSHFFSAQLSYLISGGLSVSEALSVFEQNMHEPFSRELGRHMKQELEAGFPFDQVVSSYPFFEEELCSIVKHGQENGKLAQELYFYSRHCLLQLEGKTDRWMKAVQPALYSVIGLLIVSLYLAILLPMFQLIQGF